ncbi:hypothetical protein AP75_00140 [Kaistella haifensis DSM 19056]|uniref:Signal peptidase n=1 Tax=Kaistella haifensis DSM 19056 TaxID=1450526 RepID=A0A246BCI6_9FLAO|nr:hypothetical protein [Kaistella haifensis]OWK99393.1 hypothetical protein AP75_00140 [Kaistella haifensis DSM 19056]
MKNKLKFLIVFLITFFSNVLVNAQFEGSDDPPPPEDIGSPASPIDMYLYLLAIVAFGFMWYYHAKTRKTLG